MIGKREAALAAVALAAWMVAACVEERVPTGVTGDAAAGPRPGGATSSAATTATGGGGGSGGSGGDGAGGAEPPPVVADCACLAGARDADCHLCLDDAERSDGACAAQGDVCDEVELGYCSLVIDCAALCPTPDATCLDVCLGAEDAARQAAEELIACACRVCASACGAGDCG